MQNFVIATENVVWGAEKQNSLTVRGLSFQDFTLLFTQYGKPVDEIFQFIERAQSGGAVDFNAKAFGADLISTAPQAVASLIALAADEPDQATKAARMPLPVQIRCLEAIYKLTVEEAGGLNDFLALVMRIAKGVSQTARLMSSHQKINPNNEKPTGT
jgi:hypothetical protein